MKIGCAQINSIVGDFSGNATLIYCCYEKLVNMGAELVITPELALTGYIPLDMIFSENFMKKNLEAVDFLQQKVSYIPLLVGCIHMNLSPYGKRFFNTAILLRKNLAPVFFYKRLLPSYDVFDELRYFEPGVFIPPIEISNTKVGITICEDIWPIEYLNNYAHYNISPINDLISAGAEIIVNLSASPFYEKKPTQRLQMLKYQSEKFNVPIYCCNAVGGNDHLIFDGHSLSVNPNGFYYEMLGFQEDCQVIDNSIMKKKARINNDLEEIYHALILGIRDYFNKSNFQRAIIGLSGGIDSAVTAVLAVEALGPSNVTGIILPGPYSSAGSKIDALLLIKNLEIAYESISIVEAFQMFQKILFPIFDVGRQKKITHNHTDENLQARLRGLTLMSIANQTDSLVLNTGNKSEIAVGYCTLYGDMCGALSVLGDVYKTVVYKLAHWINREYVIIPSSSIFKPPSAELKPNQRDQDTLPPYPLLDTIIKYYVELNLSIDKIIELGYDEDIVQDIISRINKNQYKRQQGAPQLNITCGSFEKGRRWPTVHHFL